MALYIYLYVRNMCVNKVIIGGVVYSLSKVIVFVLLYVQAELSHINIIFRTYYIKYYIGITTTATVASRTVYYIISAGRLQKKNFCKIFVYPVV